MTRDEANTVRIGDIVTQAGVRCKVTKIAHKPGPTFTMTPTQVCSEKFENFLKLPTHFALCGLPGKEAL